MLVNDGQLKNECPTEGFGFVYWGYIMGTSDVFGSGTKSTLFENVIAYPMTMTPLSLVHIDGAMTAEPANRH